MTDRDRLIKILNEIFIRQYDKQGLITAEQTVDHLLANGVIVPPCKVGDKLYKVDQFNKMIKYTVKGIDLSIITENPYNWFQAFYVGERFFLTPKEAKEKAKLKEREQE